MIADDIRAELLEIRDRCDRALAKLEAPTLRERETSPWMTPAEYALYAGLCAATVLRMRKVGMPSTGSGRLIRIHREQADKWRSSTTFSSAKTAGGSSP